MSWEVKPLGELCEVVTKGTTPTTAGYRFQESGINFIKVESIGLSGELLPDMFSYVSEECHREQARSQLKENDILFSIAGALGRAALVGQDVLPANTNQALAIVRLREDAPLDHRFLLKLLASSIVTDQTAVMSGGAAQQNLSLAQVKDIKVPIPPLPEQQRIVGKLDAAFAALAEAQAHVERNRANARELFESYLNGVFDTAHKGWRERPLAEVATLFNGRAYSKPELLREGKYVVLRVGNFFTNRSWYYSDMELGPEKYCDTGDLLYAWSASFGPRIWAGGKVIYHYHIWKIVITERELSKEYLFRYLQWDADKLKAQHSKGTTMAFLTKSEMEKRPLHYPDMKTQLEIVKKLDEMKARATELETTYQQKLLELAGLKKAVLGAAFRGEL